jgi:hypothetical protein
MNRLKPTRIGFGILAALSLGGIALAHDGAEHALTPPPDARSVTELVLAGEGADTYQSVPNWCQMPEGRKNLGATHGGVVVDKKGDIYFSMDAGPQGILVYSPEGKMIRGFAEKYVGIHGMCINEENGEEFIYAAHLAGKQVLKMKLDGTVLWTIPVPKESGKYDDPKKQYSPTGIAVAPSGDVYVVDGYGQNWVHQFDKNQKYVRSFGGPGKEPGKFATCHGIALDTRGPKPLLLICDRANRRLQHFDLDGIFVAVITENLRLPCAVSIRGDRVAIAELEGRVAIIDGTNKVISTIGDNPNKPQRGNYNVPPKDWKDGIFNAAHGLSYDKDGNLYVEDWNASGRVSRMNKVGEKANARVD